MLVPVACGEEITISYLMPAGRTRAERHGDGERGGILRGAVCLREVALARTAHAPPLAGAHTSAPGRLPRGAIQRTSPSYFEPSIPASLGSMFINHVLN